MSFKIAKSCNYTKEKNQVRNTANLVESETCTTKLTGERFLSDISSSVVMILNLLEASSPYHICQYISVLYLTNAAQSKKF